MHLCNLRLNTVNNVNGISLGLFAYENQYGRFAIGTTKGVFVSPIVNDIDNVSYVDRFTIIIGNNYFLNIINAFIFTNGTNGNFHITVLYLTTGSIVVAVIDFIENSLEGDIIFR